MSLFDGPFLLLLAGHGNPFYEKVQQYTFPIELICLGAAAIVAGLWLLAELLD